MDCLHPEPEEPELQLCEPRMRDAQTRLTKLHIAHAQLCEPRMRDAQTEILQVKPLPIS
jgi:hypothetical protein